MINLEEIKQIAEDLKPLLRDQFGVTELWVFGSFVRREEALNSDLDLLVEIDNPNMSLLDFIDLEMSLSERFGIPVDLVEKDALKPGIGEHILREAQPV